MKKAVKIICFMFLCLMALGCTNNDLIENNNSSNEKMISEDSGSTIIKEEVVEVEIEYSSTTEKDSTKLTSYKKIKMQGSNGSKNVYYAVTYDKDGNEISREVEKEEIIEEPVNEVIVVGTKTLGINEYIALKDNEAHKYSLVYSSKDECEKNARNENLGDEFPYGEKMYQILQCDEIKDANETHYWGMYFIDSISNGTGFYY